MKSLILFVIGSFACAQTPDVVGGANTASPIAPKQSLSEWCGHPEKPDIKGMKLTELAGPGS